MDFSNILCWLIPLLVGVICAILGYLLGRLFGNSGDGNDYSADLDACNRRNSQLQADLDACRAKLSAKPAAASSTASMASGFAAGAATAKAPSGVSFDAAAAKAAIGKKIKEDDLTVVEGIGPKIKELFHNFDIDTWAKLGAASVDKCQEVLNSGGKRFEIHNPGSWPKQAEMAAQGKWAELKKWQDEHDYGKA